MLGKHEIAALSGLFVWPAVLGVGVGLAQATNETPTFEQKAIVGTLAVTALALAGVSSILNRHDGGNNKPQS